MPRFTTNYFKKWYIFVVNPRINEVVNTTKLYGRDKSNICRKAIRVKKGWQYKTRIISQRIKNFSTSV